MATPFLELLQPKPCNQPWFYLMAHIPRIHLESIRLAKKVCLGFSIRCHRKSWMKRSGTWILLCHHHCWFNPNQRISSGLLWLPPDMFTCFPTPTVDLPSAAKSIIKHKFDRVTLCSETISDFQSLGPHQRTKASVRDLTLWYFSNFVSFWSFFSSFPQLISLCVQWPLHYSHAPGMVPPECFWNCSSLCLECSSLGYFHGLYPPFLWVSTQMSLSVSSPLTSLYKTEHCSQFSSLALSSDLPL